jgi:hypothetical protein
MAASTCSSVTPSFTFTLSSAFCLSKSAFFTPSSFFSSALITSPQLPQSAAWMEKTCVRSARATAGRRTTATAAVTRRRIIP